MSRFLPPLLVLLVLGLVGVRWALEPSRAEARERIRGLVQGGVRDEATARLEAYLADGHDEDDAWFATWAWFRLLKPDRAMAQVWDHPALPARADTNVRFARTALEAIGWEDERREEATAREPFSLVALAERENDWAETRLRRHARELDLMASTSYFFPAYRRATRRPLRMIVEEYRKRGDVRFEVAAAIGTLDGFEGPQAEADERNLRNVLSDDRWRRSIREVWCVSALALGRRATPGALATLEAAAQRLEGSVNEIDQQDLQLVYVGMLASGRFDLHDRIAPAVYGEQATRIVTVWYLEALIHRYLQGDERSEVWLRRMWEGPGARYGGLRARVARAFLLQESMPGPEAMDAWVGRMLADLERPDAPPTERVLAAAFRLRRGEAGARDGLVGMLRQIAEALAAGAGADRELSEPFLEGLRALYLYGGDDA